MNSAMAVVLQIDPYQRNWLLVGVSNRLGRARKLDRMGWKWLPGHRCPGCWNTKDELLGLSTAKTCGGYMVNDLVTRKKEWVEL